MFEKKLCSSLFYEKNSKSGLIFDICSFEAKNEVFEFDYQHMNTFKFMRCSKNDVQACSIFVKMVFESLLLIKTISNKMFGISNPRFVCLFTNSNTKYVKFTYKRFQNSRLSREKVASYVAFLLSCQVMYPF